MTRAINLYAGSDLDLDAFCDLLIPKRAATQKRSGSIRAGTANGENKSKVAYLFSLVEDVLGRREA